MLNYSIQKACILVLICVISGLSSCSRKPINTIDAENIVIYPAPPAETRIQYLTSFSSSTEFSGNQTAFKKFVFGEETPLPILKPYGISIEGSKLYICDTGIRGLEIINLETKTFQYFIPKGKGQLQLPINCDVDANGNIYIADAARKQIVIFNKELKYVNAISLSDNHKPTDLEVGDSKIWVSVVDSHTIQVFNKDDLSFYSSFPKKIKEDSDYLYQPTNITRKDSIIYVSDVGDCKIKLFENMGEYKSSFGGSGKGFGQFTRPKGISVDDAGNIYVVDAAFENIQIFNPSGKLLMHFGGTYTGPGGMWLPADVEVNYQNTHLFQDYVESSYNLKYLIFVSNQYGPDKISVYGFVGPAD